MSRFVAILFTIILTALFCVIYKPRWVAICFVLILSVYGACRLSFGIGIENGRNEEAQRIVQVIRAAECEQEEQFTNKAKQMLHNLDQGRE